MIRKSLVGLLAVCALSGCISTKSYVDTRMHDLTWTAVQKPAQAHTVKLDVEFYRNGERYPRADKVARGAVERALGKSGVVTLDDGSAPTALQVKLDNIADLGKAAGSGFVTGLTFGGKGSVITDGYKITIAMTRDGKVVEKSYEHALHTTIGNADPVTQAAPVTPVQGFDQVVEDAVIHFLRDAQSEGLLVLRLQPRPTLG
ncbi:hypothetical protein ACFOLC_12860 [Lysobacter cavernae]|uniref:DUF4410 domain-containing protein n=1 Tax=Lysobacter cavernae TaxID=1685901 RepID=A0ABV7RUK9_9GAMM